MNPEVVYEIQVSENAESDPPSILKACKKNPGHAQFIPVPEFDTKHLPKDYRDPKIVDLVGSLADVTVRIRVGYTSRNRPDVFPGTSVPYPSHEHRGKHSLINGTGWVWRVFLFEDTGLHIICPCRECKVKGRVTHTWGEIQVYTAAHVVFDEEEARNTSLKFFYDSDDSQTVELDGWRVDRCDVTLDRCLLVFETCDLALLEKVERMQTRWWDKWDTVNRKYQKCEAEGCLTIIVSHPHGCRKMVSVGEVLRKSFPEREGTDRVSTYTYTTCTCPGSSGARVYLLRGEEGWVFKHLHSGVDVENNNFSGLGGDCRYRVDV